MRKANSFYFIVIMFLVLLIVSCATQTIVLKKDYDFNKIKRIAVLPFKAPAFNEEKGSMVSQLFVKYLLKAGYDVIEREELDAILREHQLSQTNLMDSNYIKQLKLLGIDALVAGSITKSIPEREFYEDSRIRFIAAQCGLTCRMIDVTTGEIIWAGSDTYEGMTEQSAFDYIAYSLVNELVKRINRLEKEKY